MEQAKQKLLAFRNQRVKEQFSVATERDNVFSKLSAFFHDFWRFAVAEYPLFTYTALFFLYLTFQLLANYLEFGVIYLICAMFVVMFCNLGKKKEGEISAYSVFNENCERLPGQMTAEHFEESLLKRQRRHVN